MWTVIIRPIRSHKSCTVKSILISPGTERYCGSAHTSWEQSELPQDTVKKKKKKQGERKEKKASIFHQTTLFYLVQIKASTPTVLQVEMALLFFAPPQVEQQSDSAHFFHRAGTSLCPSITRLPRREVKQRVESARERQGQNMLHTLNFLTLLCCVASSSVFVLCVCVCVFFTDWTTVEKVGRKPSHTIYR